MFTDTEIKVSGRVHKQLMNNEPSQKLHRVLLNFIEEFT